MSYYTNIYFKKVSSLEEGVKILNDYIKEYKDIEIMRKVIENNMEYLNQQFKKCGVDLDEICEKYLEKNYINDSTFFNVGATVLQPLLTFNARYYPKFNLLALCIKDSTNTIDKYFDGNIEFQNSCDQDYDYETWNILGDYFINKAKEYEKMPVKELIDTFEFLDEEDEEFKEEVKEDVEHRLNYFRKVAMYAFVYDALDLDNWIYNYEQKEGIFLPLTLKFGLLTARYDYIGSSLNYFIGKLCERYKENLEEKDILTKKERKYLKAVIKPFKDRIRYISCLETIFVDGFKTRNIEICVLEHETHPCYYEFPTIEGFFEGMELEREYTLKELGLN